MADEKGGKGSGSELYERGRWYKLDARLGRLREARNVVTGTPALTLIPNADVEWQPGGPCRMSLCYEPEQNCVTADVEQVPSSANTSELTNLLVMMAAVFKRVEDDAEIEAHLLRFPVRRRRTEAPHVCRVWPSWTQLGAVGVALLTTGLGVWALLLWPRAPEALPSADVFVESPFFADGQDLALAPIAYPMPETPFKEQRKPPCLEGTETEIRGGCWIQHKMDAPCPRNTAAYEGKCFIPVKRPEPIPRSAKP